MVGLIKGDKRSYQLSCISFGLCSIRELSIGEVFKL